jgi:hypothetical protein
MEIAKQILAKEAKRRQSNKKSKQQKTNNVQQWVLFYNQIKSSESPKKEWRKLCMTYHPDHGGNAIIFDSVMTAWNYYKAA